MAVKDWSTTAADNATVGAINWKEGQLPGTVNNSAREMMAQLAYGLKSVRRASVDEDTSLSDLVSALGSSTKRMVRLNNEAWNVTADLTIPSNLSIWLTRGGTFNVSAGVTLTINGAFITEESAYNTGSGTVTVNGELVDLADLSNSTVTATGSSTPRPLETWLAELEGIFSEKTVAAADTLFSADRLVNTFLDITPGTSHHHDAIHVFVDASGQNDGNDKVAGLFSTKGDGTVDIFGLNSLISLANGYSGGANSIEVDVNNRSGTANQGVGVLINGSGTSKVLAGMIIRMNAGPSGGATGLRIEDDWDDQIVLEGTNTNSKLTHVDSGNNAQFDWNMTPVGTSDSVAFRMFRSTNATGGTRIDIYKGDNTSTLNIQLDAANGRINLTGHYRVDGTQVVSNRVTGWGGPTGTATRTAFATSTVTTEALAQRVKALIDDLTTHGMIGA